MDLLFCSPGLSVVTAELSAVARQRRAVLEMKKYLVLCRLASADRLLRWNSLPSRLGRVRGGTRGNWKRGRGALPPGGGGGISTNVIRWTKYEKRSKKKEIICKKRKKKEKR
jgi:hypothetical protein